MYKVKATVTGFGKDESKGPCDFQYKIGEEIIFNGETVTGRVCPNMLVPFSQAFMALFASGGRHKEGEATGSYYPFWHSPQSLYDPSRPPDSSVAVLPQNNIGKRAYAMTGKKGVWIPAFAGMAMEWTISENPPQSPFFKGGGWHRFSDRDTPSEWHVENQ